MRRFAVGCFVALLFAARLPAQTFTTSPCHGDEGNTSNNSWFAGHQERVCEVRSTVAPLINGQLHVSGKDGGIEVIGEDRNDIALEARVVTEGSNRDEAKSLQHEIRIVTGSTIQAEGPQRAGFWSWAHHSWYVNYRLRVPRHLAAFLHTENGGIEITDVEGAIQADTTNGGLGLHNLAGEVHASTVNGGLAVTLKGDQWRGNGLFARSTNGGVSVKAPSQYSAHLIAETVNGGISVGFPITIRGKIENHLDTNIGQGGATLKLQTVNGGVSVDRD